MSFLFLLIIIAAVSLGVWSHRRREMAQVFASAAQRLDLSITTEGAVAMKPWIYGSRDGIRVDVRPFTHRTADSRGQWTGYRLSFRDPVEMTFSGADDPRRRLLMSLSREFRESEVDAEGIFCARPSVPIDPGIIVADVELLLRTARGFSQPHHPNTPFEISSRSEPLRPPPIPQRDNVGKTPETVTEPVAPGRPAPNPPPPPDAEPASDTSMTPDLAPALIESTLPVAAAPSALDLALADLSGTGRNRYEVGQRYLATYHGILIDGQGILRKVERFSHHRWFGRGPGLLAEIEIRLIDSADARRLSAIAVAELIDSVSSGLDLIHWRDLRGTKISFCGTPVHFDPFQNRLYLREVLVELPQSAMVG